MEPVADGSSGERAIPICDDATILKEISRGNLEHFETFVERHKTRLMSYVHRCIGDTHRAEDITQEVFLRAFRAARRAGYRGDPNAAAWLFSIARNCLIDYLRARSRQRAALQSHPTGPPQPEAPPYDRPSASSEPAAVPAPIVAAGGIGAILAKLPEPQREVLALKVFAELTFAEIAQMLGCKLPTVKSRMRYALSKVRELLMQAGSADNG